MVEMGPVDQEGCAYRKTEETDLCWSATVETGVLFIERAVAYRITEKTALCSTDHGLNGILFIERGVVYRKTGIHGILFISTVDPLQSP